MPESQLVKYSEQKPQDYLTADYWQFSLYGNSAFYNNYKIFRALIG